MFSYGHSNTEHILRSNSFARKKKPWQSPLLVFAQEISAAKKPSRVFDFCFFFLGGGTPLFPTNLGRGNNSPTPKPERIIGESSTCSRKSLLLCMVQVKRALSWLPFDNGEVPSLGTCTIDIGGGRRAKVLIFLFSFSPIFLGEKLCASSADRRKRERERRNNVGKEGFEERKRGGWLPLMSSSFSG